MWKVHEKQRSQRGSRVNTSDLETKVLALEEIWEPPPQTVLRLACFSHGGEESRTEDLRVSRKTCKGLLEATDVVDFGPGIAVVNGYLGARWRCGSNLCFGHVSLYEVIQRLKV